MNAVPDAETPTTVHIINHTHWDREWFLTSEYTSRWIPGLIDKLEQLAADNPDFHFLLDGQTLVIEDLLAVAPHYAPRVKRLVADGHLIIGPYYCQPDWKLAGGELLVRNLQYGQQDVQELGGTMKTGWLVDTFGHISQSPQIHRLFGIEAVYVWRGVPRLVPYFDWEGADGSRLFAINLFGGYRNLYGVTRTPEVAIKRLHAEVEKLRPYYPTADIPLFDGYDLEDDPEDPVRFFSGMEGIDPALVLQEATPATFARHIIAKGLSLPTLRGELNSGKYGAVFPGTLSTRTYLKVMAHDCEQLLFQRCEPLAVMAHLKGRPYNQEQYARWGRRLLQNAVHDCICGVSIDQVHEKMEYSYRQLFDTMQADIHESLAAILDDFAPGLYAVSTVPFTVDQWQAAEDELLHVQTDGVGVWPVRERVPIEKVAQSITSFTWHNEHYTATVDARGVVHVNGATLGMLVVSAEHGDTYSDEVGGALGVVQPDSAPVVEQRSAHHAVVRFAGTWRGAEAWVTATVRLTFDPSPVIKWQIDLDSRGRDLRVEAIFETGKQARVLAGMPFDVVERPAADTDLLPRQLPPELAGVLLGQRELGAVRTFPFHDFVALSDATGTVAVLAQGLHAYTADEQGAIRLVLRRAVEWLTRADLKHRVGDAGPFFYVPDARCERTVRHHVGVAFVPFAGDSLAMQWLNRAYQNPPLIVRHRGEGTRTEWRVLQEDVPLSSLQVKDGVILARFYNPTSQEHLLSHSYRRTDIWGMPGEEVGALPPKAIITVVLPAAKEPSPGAAADVQLLVPPPWRVGPNTGRPDPAVLAHLEAKVAALGGQLAHLQAQLDSAADEKSRLLLLHRIYMLQREQAEFRLSLALNRRKLAQGGTSPPASLHQLDEEVAALGLALNRLRIKRRIFDYVVAALEY